MSSDDYDNGYRAGLQLARQQIAEGVLPSGSSWETVLLSQDQRTDEAAGLRGVVGPKIPIQPEQVSEEALADPRRRLSGDHS